MARSEVVLGTGEYFRVDDNVEKIVDQLTSSGPFVVLTDSSGHKHWVRPEAVAEVREAPEP
jgi:hypothetical protein